MLLTTADIYSRIYEEIVNEITRDEDDLVTRALTAAEQEAKMYLSRYDLTALFGTTDDAPATRDIYLVNICTDIACWNLVKLGHPSVKYDHSENCYKMAIDALKNIMKGMAQPDGWQYRETTGQTAPNGSSVSASYNAKRGNNY